MPKRIFSKLDKKIYRFREGGNFYMRYSDEEICLETTDEKEAIENKEFQEAQMRKIGPKAFSFKVKQLFPVFLKDKKGDVRERTFNLYESIWKTYLEKRIGNHTLSDIDQRNWDRFCKKTPNVSDFQNHRNLVHQFMVWCEAKRYIKGVPTLKNPKHKRKKQKIIPPEHLTLIFEHAAKSRGGLLVFLSFITFHGNRTLEIMALPWSAIDLDRNCFILSDEAVKTDDGREVPLNLLTKNLLIHHRNRQMEAGIKTKWVFPSRDDAKKHMSGTGFRKAWTNCLKRAGLEECGYTFHNFRATYEKWMHKSKDYTATQREKMVGASEQIQKRHYISMDADDLRGMENVLQIPEITAILINQTSALMVTPGIAGKTKNLKSLKSRSSSEHD
jgi:integrase